MYPNLPCLIGPVSGESSETLQDAKFYQGQYEWKAFANNKMLGECNTILSAYNWTHPLKVMCKKKNFYFGKGKKHN